MLIMTDLLKELKGIKSANGQDFVQHLESIKSIDESLIINIVNKKQEEIQELTNTQYHVIRMICHYSGDFQEPVRRSRIPNLFSGIKLSNIEINLAIDTLLQKNLISAKKVG